MTGWDARLTRAALPGPGAHPQEVHRSPAVTGLPRALSSRPLHSWHTCSECQQSITGRQSLSRTRLSTSTSGAPRLLRSSTRSAGCIRARSVSSLQTQALTRELRAPRLRRLPPQGKSSWLRPPSPTRSISWAGTRSRRCHAQVRKDCRAFCLRPHNRHFWTPLCSFQFRLHHLRHRLHGLLRFGHQRRYCSCLLRHHCSFQAQVPNATSQARATRVHTFTLPKVATTVCSATSATCAPKVS